MSKLVVEVFKFYQICECFYTFCGACSTNKICGK